MDIKPLSPKIPLELSTSYEAETTPDSNVQRKTAAKDGSLASELSDDDSSFDAQKETAVATVATDGEKPS